MWKFNWCRDVARWVNWKKRGLMRIVEKWRLSGRLFEQLGLATISRANKGFSWQKRKWNGRILLDPAWSARNFRRVLRKNSTGNLSFQTASFFCLWIGQEFPLSLFEPPCIQTSEGRTGVDVSCGSQLSTLVFRPSLQKTKDTLWRWFLHILIRRRDTWALLPTATIPHSQRLDRL